MTVIEKLFTLLELKIVRERFAYQQEKWVANGDNTCPICRDLENIGWVPLGTLPKYKHAHSQLGGGNWKAPDSSCQCVKGYRRTSGDNPGSKELVYTPGYGWTAVDIGLAKDKVNAVFEKYKGVQCTCGKK